MKKLKETNSFANLYVLWTVKSDKINYSAILKSGFDNCIKQFQLCSQPMNVPIKLRTLYHLGINIKPNKIETLRPFLRRDLL